MHIYAMSDLHVHCEEQPYLFTKEKETIFARVASEILETESQLVIGGDCFDFTGMQSPKYGHRAFFEEIFSPTQMNHPEILQALASSDRRTQLLGIRDRFPIFFNNLASLVRQGKLIMIAGNHDCELRSEEVQLILADVLEVAPEALQFRDQLRVGEVLFATHGHQFDPSNQTDSSCDSRGVAITAALYKALMPALRVFGVPETIVYAIPAVRPEEMVIRGIKQYLGEKDANRLVAAFIALIAKNGYFRGLKRALMLALTYPIPGLSRTLRGYLTPEHLARALPDDSGMKAHVREEAERLYLQQTPRPRAVVLGHTHELDCSEHYLNLGTWIDHITGVSLDHLEAADNSLPVLRTDKNEHGSEALVLHDARDLKLVSELKQCRKIFSIS